MKTKSLLLTAVATIGLAAATLAQSVPSYVPTNGLVGWWPFNGNANDESGNGNNGTVNGATLTTDRFGNANMAYSFDGVSTFIEVLDNNTLDFANMYSLSVWVNLPDYSFNNNATYPQRTMIGKPRPNNPNNTTGMAFRALEGAPYYFNNNKSFVSAWTNTTVNSGIGTSDSIPLNNWTQLIFTYDGSTAKLYQNGVLVNSINTIYSLLNSTESLFIGKEHSSNSNSARWFKGKLDDIGIWNRALTQQEISDLYNGNICYQNITVTDTLLINTGITGFNPVTYNNTIKIFPNPTNDHITIDYGNFASLSGYQLKIENSLGQQVFQTNITQQTDYLSLATWGGNGIYFVRIIDPQGNTIDIRKIVLQ